MAKRKKIIRAGQLVRAVAYTVANSTGDEAARRARLRFSSAARQKMNLNTSAKKLQMLLNSNYGPRDLLVTLNYDDLHRPETKEMGAKLLRQFLPKLRAAWKSRGHPLIYIYTTEKMSSDSKHVHHHLVINATGEGDFRLIRELWGYGTDIQIQFLRDWGLGMEALAQYLTKEPRICGKPEVGARTWTPSLGMKRPDPPESGYLKDDETIQEPFGAIILQREEKKNSFGTFIYLEYWVPKSAEDIGNWSPPKKE